jgi:hypothetical protein
LLPGGKKRRLWREDLAMKTLPGLAETKQQAPRDNN